VESIVDVHEIILADVLPTKEHEINMIRGFYGYPPISSLSSEDRATIIESIQGWKRERQQSKQ
jgi:hypothetical protein